MKVRQKELAAFRNSALVTVVLGQKIILCNFCWPLQFNREGVLLLRSLDSRLTKDLPSDLQKLRCKVLPVSFSHILELVYIFSPHCG